MGWDRCPSNMRTPLSTLFPSPHASSPLPVPNTSLPCTPALGYKKQKRKETTQESSEAAPLNNSQRTFDDIITDYKRDALGISQGKPVNNPRLRDILQDYSDERHIL